MYSQALMQIKFVCILCVFVQKWALGVRAYAHIYACELIQRDSGPWISECNEYEIMICN